MELLNICGLKKSYFIENSRTMKKEKVEVIKNISLQIKENESVSIMGKSGCGKTTLLKMLGGLLMPSGGDIFYKGESMTHFKNRRMEEYRRKQVGFVFQDYRLLENMTIKENMILPLMLDHRDVKESVRRVDEMAERLQISHRMDYYPSELSGGEKQRAAIGRALIHKPSLILADEPTGNLDSVSSEMVMELLVRLQRELNVTMVLVTHDREIADYCNRVIKIADGKIDTLSREA